MTDRPLYDVVPEWSPERKEAFVMYRDMGTDRNLRGVAQALQKSLTLLGRWSKEDGWQLRVASWDAEQDRIRQKAAKEELERITKKHARAIESTITVLMQPAMKLAQEIENGDHGMLEGADPIMLANLAAQAGKQLPALVQASRLIHGVSTQNVEVKSDTRIRIEGASPEELDSYLTNYDDGADEIIDGTARELTEGSDDAEASASRSLSRRRESP
jgi:hypothetical protein